jgi:hypothetical protein
MTVPILPAMRRASPVDPATTGAVPTFAPWRIITS